MECKCELPKATCSTHERKSKRKFVFPTVSQTPLRFSSGCEKMRISAEKTHLELSSMSPSLPRELSLNCSPHKTWSPMTHHSLTKQFTVFVTKRRSASESLQARTNPPKQFGQQETTSNLKF
eukprot:1901155-Amphidinium_carterae.1